MSCFVKLPVIIKPPMILPHTLCGQNVGNVVLGQKDRHTKWTV
jgi:hypothetical protein